MEMYPLEVSLTGLGVESSVSGMIGGGSGTLGLSDWMSGGTSSTGPFKEKPTSQTQASEWEFQGVTSLRNLQAAAAAAC